MTNNKQGKVWPSQWGVPLIPEWIPSRRQCTSLRRLLITLMFVIVMLCPILFNGKRWVRNDHNRKHTPLNVLNPLTDFEKPLTETIYLTCSIIWCHQLNQKVRYEKSKNMRNRDKNCQWLPLFYLHNSLTEFFHLLHVFIDPLYKHFGKTEYR